MLMMFATLRDYFHVFFYYTEKRSKISKNLARYISEDNSVYIIKKYMYIIT